MSKPVRIPCPACGVQNVLPRVYCSACGERLNEKGDADRALQQLAKKPRAQWKKRLRPFIRGLAGLLFILVALLFWPVTPDYQIGPPADARRFAEKLGGLALALDMGLPARETFSEKEVNAYLQRMVTESLKGRAALERLGIQLGEGEFRLVIQLRKYEKLSLSHIYHVVQQADGSWRVVSLHAGHLWIPGWVAHPLAVHRTLLPIVQKGLPDGMRVLTQATHIQSGNGALVLEVGSAP